MMTDYTDGGSMKGSGIDSEVVVLDIDCHECGHVWEADLYTNDWGAISNEVKCPDCGYEFTFEREADEYGIDEDQDWLFDK